MFTSNPICGSLGSQSENNLASYRCRRPPAAILGVLSLWATAAVLTSYCFLDWIQGRCPADKAAFVAVIIQRDQTLHQQSNGIFESLPSFFIFRHMCRQPAVHCTSILAPDVLSCRFLLVTFTVPLLSGMFYIMFSSLLHLSQLFRCYGVFLLACAASLQSDITTFGYI